MERGRRPRPAGVLPLGLRGQPVGQSLLPREPLGERRRVAPAHEDDRLVVRLREALLPPQPPVRGVELLVLGVRDLVHAHVEGTADRHPMDRPLVEVAGPDVLEVDREFVGVPEREAPLELLARRVAERPHERLRQQRERLPHREAPRSDPHEPHPERVGVGGARRHLGPGGGGREQKHQRREHPHSCPPGSVGVRRLGMRSDRHGGWDHSTRSQPLRLPGEVDLWTIIPRGWRESCELF